MADLRCGNDEVVRRGEEWYQRVIRPKVEPGNRGKTIAIDVTTGDYEVDDDHLAAVDRLRARHPNAEVYGMLIGYPAFAKIGGSWAAAR